MRIIARVFVSFGLMLVIGPAGCVMESEPVSETFEQRDQAIVAGSCAPSDCGAQSSSDACYCDELCVEYGDCCADVAEVCEPEPTCLGAGAYCDIVCAGEPGPLLAPECDVPSCACDEPEPQCMDGAAYCDIVCAGEPGPLLAPECPIPGCACEPEPQCMDAAAYCGIVCAGQPGPLLAPECAVPSCACEL